jgi:hypothetical protein
VIATAATVGILTLDSALGAFSVGEARGTARDAAMILVNLLAAAVAFWVARELRQSTPERRSGELLSTIQRDLWPALIAFVCFLVPYLVLAVEAFSAWRRVLLGKDDLVHDPEEAKRAETEHRLAVSAWKERREQLEKETAERIDLIDEWYPAPFSTDAGATCVFGGKAASWTAALTTLGASLLGSGFSVTIGDLSERLTTHELSELCRSEGFAVAESVFAGTLQPTVAGSRPSLDIIEVDKHAKLAESERSANELFQLLLSQVQRGLAKPRVLVILGVDRIDYDELKSLITAAGNTQIRLLLFFENFRRQALAIAGADQAAAVFFNLGNPQEAEDASSFIGAEEQLVLARQTVSMGRSHTQTPSWSRATSKSAGIATGAPFVVSAGVSDTVTESFSESSGQSTEYSASVDLTPKALVAPNELRGLGDTEMIYSEVLPGGRPAAARLDCRRSLATERRVASEPYRPASR